MSRYLLDTNIISNATRPAPSQSLLAWMADRNDGDLFIASLTIAEIRRGILEKPAGKKRRDLESWFSGPEGPPALFAGRVLPFDEKAALVWARLMAEGTATGGRGSALDMIIAAVAEANDCVVVTDNERDFAGLEIVNPLRYAAVRQSLGEPDPFRLRYRVELREIVGQLVRSRIGRKQAAARIAAWSTERIDPADRQRFVEVAESELMSLHEGNFARYQIRPSEFAAWQKVWGGRRVS